MSESAGENKFRLQTAYATLRSIANAAARDQQYKFTKWKRFMTQKVILKCFLFLKCLLNLFCVSMIRGGGAQ